MTMQNVSMFPGKKTAENLPPLQRKLANGGGGGYNESMEERVARIETRLDSIERQIGELKDGNRSIRNLIIGSAIAILAVAVPLVIHESNRNWEITQKALERATDASIRAESLRIVVESNQPQ